MLKKRRIFSILLCAILVVIISVSASASSSTQRTIYEKAANINSRSLNITPSFVLYSDCLSYSFAILFATPAINDYTSTITLQKYVNGRWTNIDSRTTIGSTSINSSFTNLEPSATYRIIETTANPIKETAYLLLYETIF